MGAEKSLYQYVTLFFKVGIALGLIGYLIYTGYFSPERLKVLLEGKAIFPGLVLMGFILLTASVRFQILSFSKMPLWQSFKLNLIGLFFNFFVPGGVGGDLVKGFAMKQSTDSTGKAAAFIVVMDRILGLATMSLLSLLSFFWIPIHLSSSVRVQVLALGLLGLFGGIIIFLGLLVSSRVREKVILKLKPWLPSRLQSYIDLFHWKQKEKTYSLTLLVRASLWSLVSQLLSIFFFFYLGVLLLPEIEVSLSVYFFVIPIGFMLTAIPIVPGGLGIGQAAFLFLFQKALNLDTDFGSISVSGFQFYQLLWGLMGAYFFIILKKKIST
jgi:glycosyltransferase 2 family protein